MRVRFILDPTDGYGDGTPDFLRLHDGGDRQAFRVWFASIAEAVADLPPERIPAEINDCSALLRYAYREALRNHDDRWIHDAQWEEAVPGPSIHQYHYPQTPLGAALFRIAPGSFQPGDLNDGSFAQFADARTLMQRNTHFVSRDIRVGTAGRPVFLSTTGTEFAVSFDDCYGRRRGLGGLRHRTDRQREGRGEARLYRGSAASSGLAVAAGAGELQLPGSLSLEHSARGRVRFRLRIWLAGAAACAAESVHVAGSGGGVFQPEQQQDVSRRTRSRTFICMRITWMSWSFGSIAWTIRRSFSRT